MRKMFKFNKKKMSKTSTELTSQDMLSVIREEGYFPHVEPDGDVSFKIKGTTFTFGTCAKGFVYGRLYYTLKSEDKWPAMLAAQHVELSFVAIKALVVPDNGSLIFSVESLCGTIDLFRVFFNRALSILSDSVGAFADKFHEYEADEECRNRQYEEAVRLQKSLTKNPIIS